jgi:hypothetical protein
MISGLRTVGSQTSRSGSVARRSRHSRLQPPPPHGRMWSVACGCATRFGWSRRSIDPTSGGLPSGHAPRPRRSAGSASRFAASSDRIERAPQSSTCPPDPVRPTRPKRSAGSGCVRRTTTPAWRATPGAASRSDSWAAVCAWCARRVLSGWGSTTRTSGSCVTAACRAPWNRTYRRRAEPVVTGSRLTPCCWPLHGTARSSPD